MIKILLVLFYVFAPLLIMRLCHRYSFLNKIGAVVVAYVTGFVIGNIGVLPMIEGHITVLELLTTLTIPLAIPLLLFSMDIRKWTQIAGKTLLSLALALTAVVIAVFAGFFIFRNQGIESLWDVSGMMVGLYTGSTPNLAAIQTALGADETNYMIIVTYDLFIGAFHLLFVMTIAQRLFLRFLPAYSYIDKATGNTAVETGSDPYWGLMTKGMMVPLMKAFFTSVVIFGIGGAATLIVPASSQMAVVILIITTLGIAASLIPAIKKIDKSFELGMYLILIFCMVISSRADLRNIDFVAVMIAAYVALVVFGSMAVQALLSWFFKIDADTYIITSTAMITNPAVVLVVAGSLRNREIVFSGLSVAIIGLAVGNYLGIFMAWFLERL
ncbi:MAG: DUF819 family protein [Bacteroidales bacterium]|jgi:uncharacterized membrane protein|nr:DUF819 family protein [Bacteroidales bacterium]